MSYVEEGERDSKTYAWVYVFTYDNAPFFPFVMCVPVPRMLVERVYDACICACNALQMYQCVRVPRVRKRGACVCVSINDRMYVMGRGCVCISSMLQLACSIYMNVPVTLVWRLCCNYVVNGWEWGKEVDTNFVRIAMSSWQASNASGMGPVDKPKWLVRVWSLWAKQLGNHNLLEREREHTSEWCYMINVDIKEWAVKRAYTEKVYATEHIAVYSSASKCVEHVMICMRDRL